jgi:geranylgeranyl diphosphate synthase type II
MAERIDQISVPALRSASAHLLGLGKLYRPQLLLATYSALGGNNSELCIDIAAAVEILHTSTLIHDDLPSLDDAELRRGVSTVHREYGEATAILAGDMLLNMAFRCVLESEVARDLALPFAKALALAMTEIMDGQALDICSEGELVSVDELVTLHAKKTGALLGVCCEMGALLAGADAELASRLRLVGINIGKGFQVRDDLLSVQSTEEHTGKTLSADVAKGKSTFPRLMGIEAAEKYASDICSATHEMISALELQNPDPLVEMATRAVERNK